MVSYYAWDHIITACLSDRAPDFALGTWNAYRRPGDEAEAVEVDDDDGTLPTFRVPARGPKMAKSAGVPAMSRLWKRRSNEAIVSLYSANVINCAK